MPDTTVPPRPEAPDTDLPTCEGSGAPTREIAGRCAVCGLMLTMIGGKVPAHSPGKKPGDNRYRLDVATLYLHLALEQLDIVSVCLEEDEK